MTFGSIGHRKRLHERKSKESTGQACEGGLPQPGPGLRGGRESYTRPAPRPGSAASLALPSSSPSHRDVLFLSFMQIHSLFGRHQLETHRAVAQSRGVRDRQLARQDRTVPLAPQQTYPVAAWAQRDRYMVNAANPISTVATPIAAHRQCQALSANSTGNGVAEPWT